MDELKHYELKLMVICLTLLTLIACSSDGPEPEQSNAVDKAPQQQLSPVTLQIGRHEAYADTLLRKAFTNTKAESLKKISLVTPQSEPCAAAADALVMTKPLLDSQLQKCRETDFDPVDVQLGNLNDGADTLHLYVKKKLVQREDVQQFLKHVFSGKAYGGNYQPADTEMINRNRGLLMLYKN